MVGTAEDPARIEQLEAELRQFRERDAVARQKIAALQDENHVLREQQTATTEILGAIAASPTELDRILSILAETAARLCGADLATVNRRPRRSDVPLVVRGGIGREALGERVWAEIQASQGAGPCRRCSGPVRRRDGVAGAPHRVRARHRGSR